MALFLKKEANMKEIKRIILKVGSSSLVNEDGVVNYESIETIISTLANLVKLNKEVILVTSGAVALGMGKLNLKTKPKKMALKQACAAVGQALLMNEYQKIADSYNLLCSQILVNHDDFENRNRMTNLTNTIEELFDNKILPIVNENDALTTEEIKVGDNDTLSALLSSMVNADMLILASDIDGLYDKNPKVYKDAKKINIVETIDETIEAMIGKVTSNVGTGGMETKIKAARIATSAGVNMAIISSQDINKITDLIEGNNCGTIFKAKNKILHSKEHWIIYNTFSKGSITVDDGAKKALLERKSLLPKGIIEVEGYFKENSVVFITDKENNKIAKGITNFNSEEIKQVKGKHSEQLKQIINSNKEEIIHANSLVLLDGEEYGSIK